MYSFPKYYGYIETNNGNKKFIDENIAIYPPVVAHPILHALVPNGRNRPEKKRAHKRLLDCSVKLAIQLLYSIE